MNKLSHNITHQSFF